MKSANRFFQNRGIEIDFSLGLEKAVETWCAATYPAAASFTYENDGVEKRVVYRSSTGNTIVYVYENCCIFFNSGKCEHFALLCDEIRNSFISNGSFRFEIADKCSKWGNYEEQFIYQEFDEMGNNLAAQTWAIVVTHR